MLYSIISTLTYSCLQGEFHGPLQSPHCKKPGDRSVEHIKITELRVKCSIFHVKYLCILMCGVTVRTSISRLYVGGK